MRKLKLGFILYTLLILFTADLSYAATVGGEVKTSKENLDIIGNIFSTSMILNIAFSIVVLIATFILSKLIPGAISSRFEKMTGFEGGNREEILGVVTRTTSVIILIIGFSACLTILGIDMGIFLGGLGFGIGFTIKVFLSNFISGVIMVTQGTYHNGDIIEIEGKMGKLKKIYALYTAVEQFDGVIYYVPNIKFLEEKVSNYHSNDKRRVEIEVGVDYDTDIVKAKKIMLQIADQLPGILKAPRPVVIVDKLGDNGIILYLRVWISSVNGDYFGTKSNLTETINLAFKKSDITIPFPQVTLSHRNGEEK